jgi:hypothetical protein
MGPLINIFSVTLNGKVRKGKILTAILLYRVLKRTKKPVAVKLLNFRN